MPKVSVKVKWGKEMYPGVEVNTDDDPVLFKAQIFALTGVQPERQKVVCKGVTLRDDAWGNFKLTNNALVLVMGSKEEDVPAAPVEQTRFVEDMNESELATALDLPEGLINLGNTCYMNATVQCLKTVPELKNALLNYDPTSGGGTAGGLTSALSETMRSLEGGGAGACAAAAARLLHALHAAAPRLAERGAGGQLAQQDASECWTEIIRALSMRLQSTPESHRYYKNILMSDSLYVDHKTIVR
ncbi:putative ubiquitin specific peptidase 14 [Danaus plexippus plexippus]|uniref:Ubiquitin carboxyl-terminal hydrolase 14 n=1 Tax=Danaus plexippus plexippus TaxID=278856 RepID=A0A212F6S6_DANPL|nr:ubiquitin carboxyl-terminal hydrolase 14-like [Danaus plexippus plexippus]OWR49441.1 putative ubiquitin specific peptidase 14 [Danaus plexippus plexippus]